jgi:ferredoxin/flavodoxin---NADP+ reductase
LRVAVIGSGPAGIYTAEALTGQQDVPVQVDVIDRLPTPFGLVRYGVAPDHLSIRSIRDTLQRLLAHPDVRFLGNIQIGVDLSLDELRRHVDAVVYTYGAARDRRLGVPGEDLPGSLAATDLVDWYCGHPDAVRPVVEEALQHTRTAVVVGVGNVAVDVARVLARSPSELEQTDMPEHVLTALAACPVTDIHVLGRRGPAQAKFTTKELRELGAMADADVTVDPGELELDATSSAAVAKDRLVARNLDVLRGWAERPPTGRSKRIHLRFLIRPVELLGEDRVTAVVLERTALDPDGSAVGTGAFSRLPAQLVVRSVGYRGLPLAGVPFDVRRNVIPNESGRVVRDGQVAVGEYVAGWIKRGPTGVIGTNKSDAHETVAALLQDAPALPPASEPDPESLTDLLAARGVRVLSLADWLAIDAAEVALGRTRGRPRTTLHEREALLRACALPASEPARGR